MTRHGRNLVPQRLREGQNGGCFNSVSWKMDENDDLRVFFSNSKVDLEGKFPCEMRFGRFRPKK